MAFFALLMQYLPMILGAVQTVETISNTMSSKPSSKDKLAAAIGIVSAAVPAIGTSIANQPANATHTENVVNGVVSALNALNGWSAQQAVQQSAGSGG